jgi:hypothetical protein
MQLRGIGELTRLAYLNKVEKIGEFLGNQPRRGKEQDVDRYLHHLMTEKRFTIPTVNQYAAALRLFLPYSFSTHLIRGQGGPEKRRGADGSRVEPE